MEPVNIFKVSLLGSLQISDRSFSSGVGQVNLSVKSRVEGRLSYSIVVRHRIDSVVAVEAIIQSRALIVNLLCAGAIELEVGLSGCRVVRNRCLRAMRVCHAWLSSMAMRGRAVSRLLSVLGLMSVRGLLAVVLGVSTVWVVRAMGGLLSI
jgi:hypothetical protein